MRRRLKDNRKWAGWLLTLALLVMAMPSGAAWQCLSGTPCPNDCPMLHNENAAAGQSDSLSRVPASHCSDCPTVPVALTTHKSHETINTTPQCVLRVPFHSTVSLAEKQILTLPMLALPPPFQVMAVPTASVRLSTPTALVFYPQCFLRPYAGRAPPFRLA
jgi:hypothetical protein